MPTTSDRLLSLTARDLMSETVLALPQDMSVQAAARALSRAQVSGAPVVDSAGRCVGVLSTTDFLTWAQGADRTPRAGQAGPGCVCTSWQIVEPEGWPEDVVSNLMTADPVTVMPQAPIAELARMMLDAHIHRVIVVDADRRPVGVVSSTNVLAAVARAESPADAEPAAARPWTPPKKG